MPVVGTDVEHSQTPEAADESRLLEMLAAHGGEATNPILMRELKWEPSKYWSVRNRLRDSGRVQKRLGGPGGTTFIPAPEITGAQPEPELADELNANTAPQFEREASLYDPMLQVVEGSWVGEQGYDSSIVRKTALAGARNTGGTWTRPDLCAIAIRKFKFLRDAVLDVVSFEVKPSWAISVEGVFEALAHRQYTTRAYVIFHVAENAFGALPESDRIIALAEQHGIGIFLAEDPGVWDRWTERVRARRWAPDPADLNEFLQRVFPSSDHDEIIKMCK